MTAQFDATFVFSTINGTLALFLTGAGALAPAGVGIAFGALGSYTPILIGVTACSIPAVLAIPRVLHHPHVCGSVRA